MSKSIVNEPVVRIGEKTYKIPYEMQEKVLSDAEDIRNYFSRILHQGEETNESEIKLMKTFLEWIKERKKDHSLKLFQFSMIVKSKELKLNKEWFSLNNAEITFEVPEDLQKRIIETVEDWVTEKEKSTHD